MPYFNQSQQFFTDKAILAFTEGNCSPSSVTVPNTYVSLNSEARKQVKEGLFVAQIGNTIRFLPRTKVTTTAVTTSDTTVTLAPSNYNIFAAGDVLYILEPHTILTITAVTAGQTQTITVNGRTATATATTSSTSTTATEVATAVNATPYLSDLIYAIASGATVYLFAKNGTSNYTVTEGGTVTATLSSATMSPQTTAIGTISSIDYLTGIATLTSTAGVAVPVGCNIGVPVDKIIGLHVHAVDYDLATSKDLALYHSAAGVRIQYLPYFDWNIASYFPKMTFDYKF